MGIRMNMEKRIEDGVAAIECALSDEGFGISNPIWRVNTACTNCPEREDHCGIGCQIEDSHYLQKTKVIKIEIVLNLHSNSEDLRHKLKFTDDSGLEFTMDDIGVTVFDNQKTAIERLWGIQSNAKQ